MKNKILVLLLDEAFKLIDMYERRGAYDKEASGLRAIQIDVSKTYPAYADRYNHEACKGFYNG
ncbi:MAG: hypothetical protein K2I01_09235 [Lachnospiraceae bacterium]|nr:hypothetical protein [Lachnospiraceae bacterium]